MCKIIDYGRQAISTRYVGPSNTKGSRIVAACERGRSIVEYDDSLNSAQAHAKAAEALIAKLGWEGETWHQGGTIDGYVFVHVPQS